MAARGHFARGALSDHAAVESGDGREFLHGNSVIDERLHGVRMRNGKIVRVERLRRDDSLPGARMVPGELRRSRLIGLSMLVDDELRGFSRFLRPVLDDSRRRPCGHGDLLAGVRAPRWTDDGNGLLQRLDTAARPPRGATEGAPSKRGARRTAGPLTPRGPPPIARPTMPRGAACAIWSRWRWPMRDKMFSWRWAV